MTIARTHRKRWASFTLAVFLGALCWAGGPPAEAMPVSGLDVLYTTDADFDQGTLLNVNHDVPNQLQLNEVAAPFPFVNIAASGRGTAIRVHADTGAMIGEYLTAPGGMGRNPSRTTVDLHGNVWVANRDESSLSGGQGKGSVTRIGIITGGTRVNSDGTPNPTGQYLQPPFGYSTCQDRDGDGLISTSFGLGNILPWSNAGDADRHGGVATAADECIINYTRVVGTNTRTIAIDPNNDVWVGGTNTWHEKLDGITGAPVPGTQINLGCGGYGGLVDGAGVLWSARFGSGLLRYDTGAMAGACLGNARGDYGLAVDPTTGEIWQTYLSGNAVAKLSPSGAVLGTFPHGNYYAQGVAVDGSGNVWVAHSILGGGQTTVGHLRTDGTYVGNVTLPGGNGPTGVAVDSNGKVWVANINSNNAMRIDPSAGPIGGGGFPVGAVDLTVNLGAGAAPYNYSDMTGFVAFGTTSPQGTWTVVQDSGNAGENWGTVTWNTEREGSEPPGSSITVEARTAETEAGLNSAAFAPVANGSLFAMTGRYIEVRATLKAGSGGESPILSDLRIETGNQPPTVTLEPAGPVNEGDGPITLIALGSDPDGDILTYTWILAGPGTLTPMGATAEYSSADGPASAVVTVTVSDGKGGTASDSQPVETLNVAPTITAMTGPAAPVMVGLAVTVTADFTDPGVLDTHTAVIDWGDGSSAAGSVTEVSGSGTASGTHTYAAPGVYTVTVTVTDKDGDSDAQTLTEYIVIYDPDGGFVTGGGWLTSPVGAYPADPALTGRANFGFVSKYRRGATVPTGQTEFQFKLADLNFHSSAYEWLVIAGARAQYKGSGTINGAGDYGFMLTAIDGQQPGGGGADKFRIKIWEKATDTVIYDNQLGAADGDEPTTLLGGGSIVIHTK